MNNQKTYLFFILLNICFSVGNFANFQDKRITEVSPVCDYRSEVDEIDLENLDEDHFNELVDKLAKDSPEVDFSENNAKISAKDGGKYKRQIIPWIVLIIFSIVTNLILLLITCVKCICLNKKKQYYRKLTKLIFIIIFGIIFLGVLVTSLIGYGFSAAILKSSERSLCSLSYTLDDFYYGLEASSDTKSIIWLGLPVLGDLTTEMKSFFEFLYHSNADSIGKNWTEYSENVKLDLKQVYDQHQNDTVSSPKTELDKITPDFISNLGPLSDSTGLTNLVYTDLLEYNNLSDRLYSIYLSTKANSGFDNSYYDTADETLSNIDLQFSLTMDNLNSFIDAAFGKNGGGFKAAVAGCIIFLLVFGLVLIIIYSLVMVLIFCCKKYGCRWCLCITWLVFVLVAIFTFVMVAILLVVDQVSHDFCAISASTINEPSNLSNLFDQELADFMVQCLSEDGNMFEFLGLGEDSGILETTINTDIEYRLRFHDGKSVDSVDAVFYELGQYQNFTLTSYSPENTSEDPEKIILTLNQWADASSSSSLQNSEGNCKISYDHVVFDSNQCDSKETIFTGDDPNEPLQYFGQEVCIGMNALDDDYEVRYDSSKYSSCDQPAGYSSVADAIQSIYKPLNVYRKEIVSEVNYLENSFASVSFSFSDYSTAMYDGSDYMTELHQNLLPTESLLDAPTDEATFSLSEKWDCYTVKLLAGRVLQMLCIDWKKDFHNLASLYIAFAVFIFLMQFALFCVFWVALPSSEDDYHHHHHGDEKNKKMKHDKKNKYVPDGHEESLFTAHKN